ncbi:MAG: 50S ribosomal protein L21 [Dehalococcoidia bacterium]|nr:50S ribosomal protein L21 [Dehalococcoidia bacterium]
MPDNPTYAIVETGGKQYKVSAGQTIQVERLPGKEGDALELGKVLMVTRGERVVIGTPLVSGARVVARSLGEVRGDKIVVFKYKNKVRYRRKTGHRQNYTRLQVTDIVTGEPAGSQGEV